MRPRLLAFASALKPQPWTPPAPELAKLQAYTRRLAALENMITQEKNRLKTTDPSLEEDIFVVVPRFKLFASDC